MDPLDRFEFSQSSLQDYLDCQRRFDLRYLQRLAWPAAPAEPVREHEQHMQRGQRFHRLVQQYLLGVPATRLARMAQADEDEHILQWWQNFERTAKNIFPEPVVSPNRFVEISLTAPLSGFRLIATMDMVQVLPDGCVQIYDWKTSLRRPRSSVLRQRLQTRVYPYLLVQAGAALTGGRPINPEQIEMTYWFADPAQAPEHIKYSRAQFTTDGEYLQKLVEQICRTPSGGFSMTSRDETCKYCVYRSLCDRGTCGGDMQDEAYDNETTPEGGLSFDLEQIAEISF